MTAQAGQPAARIGSRPHGRMSKLSTTQQVWLLIGGIIVAAALAAAMVTPGVTVDAPVHIPFLGIVAAVFLAEMAVVHLEYGSGAHSFSMSELALVVGLFFATPAELIAATILGNTLVLIVHRRQPPKKLVFNVAQFTLQAAVALFVFQTYIQFGDPLGPLGWGGAVLGVLAALLVSDLLINVVMRLSGIPVTVAEQLDAFAISVTAALLNTAMALIGVVVVWLRPSAVWLAAVPPFALFIAYRAYISQRVERDRTRMLYEATKQLHGSPRLEHALSSAAASALSMLNAEFAEVHLFDAEQDDVVWLTTAGADGTREVMRHYLVAGDEVWHDAVASAQALTITGDERGDGLAAPLVGGDGEVIGALVVISRQGDVSEFDDLDAKTLSTFAAQVAGSVSNHRLINSLAAANALAKERESLIRAKDDFIASVSHELRTPLTTVLGLSAELASPATDLDANERIELVGLIADQSNELSHLVDDLLVSARSDIGTLYMANEPIDPLAEVTTVLRELGKDAVPVCGEPRTVWGDGLRLRQIIRNLVSNADRYGGAEVRIELGVGEELAFVAVVDDGTGVPPGSEASIFEPYGRAHEPGSQPASIGLGLHVARQLARRMGGDLTYTRRDGETWFQLLLQPVGDVVPEPLLGVTLPGTRLAAS